MLHKISKPQYDQPIVNTKTEDLPHRLVWQHRSNNNEETYYIESVAKRQTHLFTKVNTLLTLRTLKGQYQLNTMINCIHTLYSPTVFMLSKDNKLVYSVCFRHPNTDIQYVRSKSDTL